MQTLSYGSVTLKDSLMSKGHGVVQRRILELLEREKGQMWQAQLIEKLALETGTNIDVVGASVRRAVGKLSQAGLIKIQYPPHARTSQLKLVGFKEKTTAQHLLSSKSNEWYTPPELIELVRVVLGTIELDPASGPTAQGWIQATQFYTIQDDGLNQVWKGKVFLNPPYGRKNLKASPPNLGASAWLEKLVREYETGNVTEAIALCRGDSEGLKLLESRATQCKPSSRIYFHKESGERSDKPVPGCAFYYLGADDARFRQTFGNIGRCSLTV